MLLRNNTKFHLQRMEIQKQHFTIKKFSVGVASVLVSCTFAVTLISLLGLMKTLLLMKLLKLLPILRMQMIQML